MCLKGVTMTASRRNFKEDFLLFVMRNGISYTEKGRVVLFPEYALAVVPVFLEDFENGAVSPESLPQKVAPGMDILYLYEDRWYNGSHIKERILARLGRFDSLFARKCRVLANASIKNNPRLKKRVGEFLERNHSYGNAKCKYRYALEYGEEIVAAATFSSPRKILRKTLGGERVYNSYEWIRYASLPGCRVVGGMGRLLKAFVKEMRSTGLSDIEVMSYSDNEWSVGAAYTVLGFKKVALRPPVEYYVDMTDYERLSERKLLKKEPSLKKFIETGISPVGYYKIKNRGSTKFLLQLE